MNGLKFYRSRRNPTLADLIKKKIRNADSIRIISGFITKKGCEKIGCCESDFKNNLDYMIVGKLNNECNKILSELYKEQSVRGKLYVNLGLGSTPRPVKPADFNKIKKWAPMIHSKIYYITSPDNRRWCYVGSANITGDAMSSNNQEAGIILTGGNNDTLLVEIREYMDWLKGLKSTVTYDPSQATELLALNRINDHTIEIDFGFGEIEEKLLVLFVDAQYNEGLSLLNNNKDILIYSDFKEGFSKVAEKLNKAYKRILFVFFNNLSNVKECKIDELTFRLGEITKYNDAKIGNWSRTTDIDACLEFTEEFLPPKFLPTSPPAKPPRDKYYQVNMKIFNENTYTEKDKELIKTIKEIFFDIIVGNVRSLNMVKGKISPVEESDQKDEHSQIEGYSQIVEVKLDNKPMSIKETIEKNETSKEEIGQLLRNMGKSVEKIGKEPDMNGISKDDFDEVFLEYDSNMKKISEKFGLDPIWIMRASKYKKN